LIQKEPARLSGLCVFGRHAKAEAIFVTEDGEEKPVCATHFVALQQMEVIAEHKRKRIESMKSK
jgi:hypothetical protein